MDILNIRTDFMRLIIARFIKKMVKAKTGQTIDISLTDCRITFDGNDAKIHICGDASIPKQDIVNLMKKVG